MARRYNRGFNLLEEERGFFDSKVLDMGNIAAAQYWDYNLRVITNLFLRKRRCPVEFLLILRRDMEDQRHVPTKKDLEKMQKHTA